MDGPHFDALAKSLGAAGPRRRLLAGLLGAALAAPLGWVGAQDCKANGKACKKNGQGCSGNCARGDRERFDQRQRRRLRVGRQLLTTKTRLVPS